MRNLFFFVITFCCSFYQYAQDVTNELQTARSLFQKKSYKDAYNVYLNIEKKLKNNNPYLNEIGQAAYKAKDYVNAANFFLKAKRKVSNKQTKLNLEHNLGNSYYQQKEYQKAVDSYKNVLRKNPNDNETRYNLALALKHLKNKQQNQNSPKKTPPQSPPKPSPKKENKEQNSQPNNSSISDQKTDQMLDDLMKKEIDTKKKKTKNQPTRNVDQSGKDW